MCRLTPLYVTYCGCSLFILFGINKIANGEPLLVSNKTDILLHDIIQNNTALPGTELGSDVQCTTNEDCINNYTPNISVAYSYNSNLVHDPYCDKNTSFTNGSREYHVCTCGEFCLSYSYSTNKEIFYYCGPCGRVGAQCTSSPCRQSFAVCGSDGFCHCPNSGTFYELSYCYIPYYGYEVALQMAITTCIIIALCLLIGSIYNAIGFRRLRRLQNIRELLRRENGVSESPPDDTPPKYEDVVEELPSYQQALTMNQNSEGEKGIMNAAFEEDEAAHGGNEATKDYLAIAPDQEIGKTNAMKESSLEGVASDIPAEAFVRTSKSGGVRVKSRKVAPVPREEISIVRNDLRKEESEDNSYCKEYPKFVEEDFKFQEKVPKYEESVKKTENFDSIETELNAENEENFDSSNV